jgi:HJR/Mrr/RecB family endonuclease
LPIRFAAWAIGSDEREQPKRIQGKTQAQKVLIRLIVFGDTPYDRAKNRHDSLRVGSFSQFYKSLDADPDKRGKQFEHFVKWFLTTDPEWSTQVAQIWLWKDYPGRWGRDCGIDLVYKHKNGQTWAVQAKCYSPEYEIIKSDVDRFLSESNPKGNRSSTSNGHD